MSGVKIRGDGVAARCCAHLLAQAGFTVGFEAVERPRLPVILLSQPAQQLIREIFGPRAWFGDAPRIGKRIVAWGAQAAPVELAHEAVVVSEETLLQRLGVPPRPVGVAENFGWTICSARPLPSATTEHRFGSRVACTVPVELKPAAEPAACWIESLPEGWLFLITSAPGSGWLVAVGSEPRTLLEQSRLIADQIADQIAVQIADREAATGVFALFASSPRMISPVGEPGWLACGSAAIGFDPICGDGTAQAVREAILAAAVITAAERGEAATNLLAHYEARLTAGFQRHLAHCRQYYGSGGDGAWWREELAATERGLAWCDTRLRGHGRFRYQLNGLQLQAAG